MLYSHTERSLASSTEAPISVRIDSNRLERDSNILLQPLRPPQPSSPRDGQALVIVLVLVYVSFGASHATPVLLNDGQYSLIRAVVGSRGQLHTLYLRAVMSLLHMILTFFLYR